MNDLYLKYKIPDNIFLNLKKTISKDENNQVYLNHRLAGNIENEFVIVNMDDTSLNFLKECALNFLKTQNKLKYSDLNLIRAWVNKQKKYEFNPLHDHEGDVSFVCWVEIPYNLDDEINLNNCKNSNTRRNSMFEFVYSNNFGCMETFPLEVDKSWEGNCIFFDSKLMHQVYPFYTSDKYRISISGNFKISTKKSIKNSFKYS